MSSKVAEVDRRLAEEENSPLQEEEKPYLEKSLAALTNEQREKLTEWDHLQIVRGYQTYEPRMEETIKAFQMIQGWRDTAKYEQLLTENLPLTKRFHEMWKETIYGTDKHGHMLIAFSYSGIDTDSVAEIDEETLCALVAQKLASYTYHKKQISKKIGQQRYKQSFVIDMKGGGMGLLSGKRRSTVKKVMDVGSDYFPESVWKIYVINTPMVLRGGWAIAKPWLHPVTQAKVNILSNVKDAVKRMMDLDGFTLDDIPDWMGGNHKGVPAFEIVQNAIEGQKAELASSGDGDGGDTAPNTQGSQSPATPGAATATEPAKGTML
eukprot:m.35415 g.35415  ORF g.35415 m.35415 type:complete len:322 (-) comp8881_c0_seq2:208-1173(-)